MRYVRLIVLSLTAVWSLAGGGYTLASDNGTQASVKEDSDKGRYIRLVRDKNEEPLALEVAIVRYQKPNRSDEDAYVDLIGAVHVGEPSYYRKLNREFRKYDVVLYELVAPKGTRVPKGGGTSTSIVSMIQRGMTNVLDLEFQLKAIDYTKKNMVHADMSPEQFSRTMKDRGESMFGMFMKMMGHAMAQQGANSTSDIELLMALFSKDRSMSLKRVMAKQFEDLEGVLMAFSGPDGSTIISERNKVALGVLKEQIDAGKKKIAIFYGAGHMPDFQERLEQDFDLTLSQKRWIVAWNLKDSPPKKKGKPSKAAEARKKSERKKSSKLTESQQEEKRAAGNKEAVGELDKG